MATWQFWSLFAILVLLLFAVMAVHTVCSAVLARLRELVLSAQQPPKTYGQDLDLIRQQLLSIRIGVQELRRRQKD